MSPLTGLGVNENVDAINMPPLLGLNPSALQLPTAYCLLPT